MRICRFCEKVIADQDELCGNCGYNPQTDTLTASFVKKEGKKESRQKQGMLSPGIKSFVFWAVIIIIFSLGVKYQGEIRDIVWKLKNKSTQASGKTKQNKTVGLTDVRSYEVSMDKTAGKNRKIEGIFYDPKGKSYVVINGRLISEKESSENMIIKKINRDSVEVIQDGEEKVLKVNK